MCDTKLIVQGQVFNIHRSFLAASSEYFFLMFTENFQESKQNEVELKGVSARGLKALLEFAYTGVIIITKDNLQDVLEAAAHLQFSEVLHFCSQYLKDEMTIENCLHFLKMAELYDLAGCKRETKAFILENFIPVAQSDDFKDLSLEMFCDFLADDRLRALSELDVFRVALKWLKKHPEREAVAKSVLGSVRYGLMNAEQMEAVYTNPLMLSDSCCDILQSALSYHMRLFKQPTIDADSHIAQMRAYHESLIIIGAGYLDNTLCTDLIAAKMTAEEVPTRFETMCAVKDKRYFAAVAVINDFVYVVGGQTAMAGDGSHATNTVFRYNPRDDKWLQLSSMNTPRTHFALVSLQESLVVVGGKHNRVALNTAEKYEFASNEWSMIANLPNTLFSHAGCAHGNQVFISGGCPGEDFTDEVHSYDPRIDGWHLKSPMHQGRGYHVMVTHGNRIFACVGNTNAGDRRDVVMTESYDVELDQWTILSPCLQGQSEAPAVKHGSKIFILGGYSWDLHSFQDTIQCYDLESDQWEVLDLHLPEPMTGVVACSVRLPLTMYDHSIVQYSASE